MSVAGEQYSFLRQHFLRIIIKDANIVCAEGEKRKAWADSI